MNNFAYMARMTMTHLNITQEELAERLICSHRHLRALTREDRKASPKLVQKLMEQVDARAMIGTIAQADTDLKQYLTLSDKR